MLDTPLSLAEEEFKINLMKEENYKFLNHTFHTDPVIRHYVKIAREMCQNSVAEKHEKISLKYKVEALNDLITEGEGESRIEREIIVSTKKFPPPYKLLQMCGLIFGDLTPESLSSITDSIRKKINNLSIQEQKEVPASFQDKEYEQHLNKFEKALSLFFKGQRGPEEFNKFLCDFSKNKTGPKEFKESLSDFMNSQNEPEKFNESFLVFLKKQKIPREFKESLSDFVNNPKLPVEFNKSFSNLLFEFWAIVPIYNQGGESPKKIKKEYYKVVKELMIYLIAAFIKIYPNRKMPRAKLIKALLLSFSILCPPSEESDVILDESTIEKRLRETLRDYMKENTYLQELIQL
jgi:hypothetical protein